MLGLYPAADIRAAEEDVMSRVPAGTLMQRAAFGLANECARILRSVVGQVSGSKIVILVGSGNNGGDALFAGARLQERGAGVRAFTLADRHHDAGARALVRAGGRISPAASSGFSDAIAQADLIIDGIVGIGARGPLRDPADTAVIVANEADALRVAVDVPSGVDADSGAVAGDAAFRADLTVTFGCAKPGLFAMPGRSWAGAVRLVDIGLAEVLPAPSGQVLQPIDVLEYFPAPAERDYKYSRGVVGVAAGSARYPGAALLTIGGARYAGVGMTVVLDRGDGVARDAVRVYPDVVTTGEDPRKLDRVRAWVCGPGLVDDPTNDALVGDLIEVLMQVPVPVVLDAGALCVVADNDGLRAAIRGRGERGAVTVLTPHAGEYRALFGEDAQPAIDSGAIVVRKGPATEILAPDGTVFVDTVGTPDLACAGSGDVLAGLIAGVLAHTGADRLDSTAAAAVAAATWMHGAAGRMAATADRPVLATDLVTALPEAIAELRRGEWSW